MRRVVAIAILVFLGAHASAQMPARSGADVARDLLLTVPPVAKAGVLLSSTIAGLSTEQVDPYPVPFNFIAYAIVGGTVTANVGLIVSSWLDLPVATRLWRRSAFAIDMGALLFGTAMLITDIINPDPSGSAVLPILGAMATFVGFMAIDTVPFSVEIRAGVHP